MTPPEQKIIVTDVKVEVLDEIVLENKETIVNDDGVMNSDDKLEENVVNYENVMNLDEKLQGNIVNDEIVMNLDEKLEENVVNDEILMNLDNKLDVIADKCLEECVVDDSKEKSDAEEVLEPVVEVLCSYLDVVEEKGVEVVEEVVPMEE